MPYRQESRRVFQSTEARPRQNEFLHRITARHGALLAFADVDALFEALRDPATPGELKDAVLLALVKEHQRGESGDPFALLAAALFPAIEHVYHMEARRQRAAGVEDDDELWGELVGAFVDVLDRYPVARRPRRVAANVQMETMSALRLPYQRARQVLGACIEATRLFHEHERAGHELPFGEMVVPGPETPVPPSPDEFSAAEALLAPYVAAGVIDEADRFLLLGRHLYDRPLGELGAEIGLRHGAAKKRHGRALSRVLRARRQEEEDLGD